jgi:3-phosphoshikimate 1-carboxyvinyltransferase
MRGYAPLWRARGAEGFCDLARATGGVLSCYAPEPDASAATYLWAAEALTRGSIDIGITSGAFTQPDAAAYNLIRQFPYLPPVIDGSQIQDAVPTLATLAVFNTTPVRFVGIANLRVKECDRIAAMATELSRLSPGLAVEDGDDLVVTPAPVESFSGAYIQTYSDHRIAMSLALAGLRVPGVTILDPGCVGKTLILIIGKTWQLWGFP